MRMLLDAQDGVILRGGQVFPGAELKRVRARLPLLLEAQTAGLSRNQLLSALPGTRAALLDEALARLVAEGTLVRRGSQIAIPRPGEDQEQARSEAELAARIEQTLLASGLMPPLPSAIVTDPQARKAVDRLLRKGIIIRAVDRAKGKELLFHRDAIEQAKTRLLPLLESEPGLLVTEIAAALGVSRKFTMPLLDHLDTIRFTRRVGDRRMTGQVGR